MAVCINCMERNLGEDGVCPNCHKSDSDIRTSRRFLPWRYILNNRYIVGKSIGKGGFANTYIAYDTTLMTRVAIKEFFPKDDVERGFDGVSVVPVSDESAVYFQEEVGKFVNEASRLARYRSETGIVTIHDIFHENSTSYIVMDYIEGPTLQAYLKSTQQPMTFDYVFNLMKPMLNTLSRVHESGMVHRDISPDNIMLSFEPTRIYLIDFGSAREAGPEGRGTLSLSYKESYSPPEQYKRDVKQGPWSDVYAICATIYRCITLKMPQGAVNRLYGDEIKKPSELGAVITPYQEEVLMKGMAVMVEDRIQTVRELLDLLKQHKNSEKNDHTHRNDHLKTYEHPKKNDYPNNNSIEAGAKPTDRTSIDYSYEYDLPPTEAPQNMEDMDPYAMFYELKMEYEEDMSVTQSTDKFVEITSERIPAIDKSEYEEDLSVTQSSF